MDSNETNKVLCAVLSVLTFTIGLTIFAGEVFKPKRLAEPAFRVATAEAPAPAAAAAPAEEAVNMAQVMASADAARGEGVFRANCASCHNAEKGGRNGAGPNLWGMIDVKKAHAEGFNYSRTLRDRAAAGETWTYEALYRFLQNPRGTHPGTTMSFAGLRRGAERADVIAYLRSKMDTPPALPQ